MNVFRFFLVSFNNRINTIVYVVINNRNNECNNIGVRNILTFNVPLSPIPNYYPTSIKAERSLIFFLPSPLVAIYTK